MVPEADTRRLRRRRSQACGAQPGLAAVVVRNYSMEMTHQNLSNLLPPKLGWSPQACSGEPGGGLDGRDKHGP